MLLLWWRIAEFLLQHTFFHSILLLPWTGQVVLLQGATVLWERKMTREIGKEVYPECKKLAVGDPHCFKPHFGAGQQTARVRSNQFVAQRHPRLLTGQSLHFNDSSHIWHAHQQQDAAGAAVCDPLYNLHMNPYPCIHVLYKAVPAYLAKHLRKAYGTPWMYGNNRSTCSHTCTTHP